MSPKQPIYQIITVSSEMASIKPPKAHSLGRLLISGKCYLDNDADMKSHISGPINARP